jgi:diadenosine tetraphosphate (Ap4A) HIT family hydrolase
VPTTSKARADCGTCKGVRNELGAPGGAIYQDRLWHLDHIVRPLPMAGWLILKPKRHVEPVAKLTAAESRALGPLISRTAAALERATGVKKVYVGVFGEAKLFAHVHIHLIPRPVDLADALRGPLIFALMRTDSDRAPVSEAERIAAAVRRSLRGVRSAGDGRGTRRGHSAAR